MLNWGNFGVGQYWSPFMDIDVFPNTVEYWGPNEWCFSRERHRCAICLAQGETL